MSDVTLNLTLANSPQVAITLTQPSVALNAGGPAGAAGPTGPAGPAGAAGPGVPVGGTTGQVLTKASNTDFDTAWSAAFVLGAHTTDELPQGTTNLYSQWKDAALNTELWLTGKVEPNHLIVGTTHDSSGIVNSFGVATRAMFIDDTNGGIGFFTNTAYGSSSFLPVGGIFIAGHANGTAAAPTASTASSNLGIFAFSAHDDTVWTINSGAYFQYAVPGFYGQALTQPSINAYDFRGYLGGLSFEAFTYDMLSSTGSSVIYLNRLNAAAATTIGSAAGTALTVNGTTGVITSAFGLNMSSQNITSVLDPTLAQHAATKNYVDTFVGSTNIVTLGTIATGTWAGSTVAVSHGGTGATTLTGVVIGNGTSAFTTVTAPSGTIVGTTDTQTLTNKRITPRITTITSSATPAVNTDNCDYVNITAQAVAITSMTTSLTGTPNHFDKLTIRFKDNGSPQTIAWGTSFEACGIALPTTTTANKRTTVGFLYSTTTSKWGCVASVTEA